MKNNLIEMTKMETINQKKTRVCKKEKKRKNLISRLWTINSNSVKRGIQILTESQEERVRSEKDKEVIRFEEDLD